MILHCLEAADKGEQFRSKEDQQSFEIVARRPMGPLVLECHLKLLCGECLENMRRDHNPGVQKPNQTHGWKFLHSSVEIPGIRALRVTDIFV
jgi:hypothetical protein